jgi:hypothetical protein
VNAFDAITWAVGAHGTLAGLSFAGFYKYGDRADSFSKLSSEIDKLLLDLRSEIGSELEESLAPVFERAPGSPRFPTAVSSGPPLIVPAQYVEQPTNPFGSEAYREAIRAFLANRGSALLADHWGLDRAYRRWCDGSRWLSWILLAALVWEAASSAALGVIGKLGQVSLPILLAAWSFLPTALLFAALVTCLSFVLYCHDEIMRCRRQHHDL